MARRCPAPLALVLLGLLGVAVEPTARAEDRSAEGRVDDRADDSERFVLRGELGVEYDSNAHRTEHLNDGAANPENVRSALGRAVLSAGLTDVIAPGQTIAIGAVVAGKVFADARARDEDVAVAQSSVDWRVELGTRANLGLSGAYYEAFQRPSANFDAVAQQRDFRSLTPTLRLGILADRFELAAGSGYRLFVFKPDQNQNFQAPTASLDLRWSAESADGSTEWDLSLGASFELRRFEGQQFVNTTCEPPPPSGSTCPAVPSDNARRDYFGLGQLFVTRTGRVLMGAGYALHWNQSNSFGETVRRHLFIARLALGLPLGLYLAARAELLIARYSDPVIVGQGQMPTGGRTFVSIDDENRSGVRADLSRALTDRLQLIARYTLYVNELGQTSGSFVRHTALLSLAFTLEK